MPRPTRPLTTSSRATHPTPSRSWSAGGLGTPASRAAFYAYAYPAPPGFAGAALSPAAARWDQTLGEYILDWDDVRAAPDPHAAAVDFLRSAFHHAYRTSGWSAELGATAEGRPPPVR